MLKVFTCFNEHPIHPRLEMQMKWWDEQKIDYKVYFQQPEKGLVFKIMNRFSLKTVRWDLVSYFKKEITSNDTVLIYDFKLLPLVKFSFKKGVKIYYETLDDNPYLYQSEFEKKSVLFKLLRKIILPYLINKEKKALNSKVNKVIVNSPNLLKLKDKNCFLLPYSSPFESIKTSSYDPNKEVCFLYIGKLTLSKGSLEYLQLADKYHLPFVFIGEARDDYSKKWVNSNEKVQYFGHLNSSQLKEKIIELDLKYNLIGLSIIWPNNFSYALQEANKDIDYLCLQIPFVGNERKPTFEKIEAGAGVLYTDDETISNLISNKNDCFNKIKRIQQIIYDEKYATKHFYEMMHLIYLGE
jgi:hypothetical protein